MTTTVNPLALLSTWIQFVVVDKTQFSSCKGHHLCLSIRYSQGMQNPGQYQHSLLPPRSEFLHKTVSKYPSYVKLINCKNRPLWVCSSNYFKRSRLTVTTSPASNDLKWLFHKILGKILANPCKEAIVGLEGVTCSQAVMKSGLGCDSAKPNMCVPLNLTPQPHILWPHSKAKTFAILRIKLYK